MKKLFLAIALLASIASCTKNDVINESKEVIIFGNPFVENSTKATDKTYSGDKELGAFNLYGTVTGTNGTINIYPGCEVTGNIGSAVWTCPVNQYWIAGASYKFAAVADGTVATTDANGMPLTITCNTAVNNNVQNDLLYAEATATGQASGNGKVNFTFSHLLSKAQFTVTSNTENGYYYNVKNILVNNYVNGTYDAQAGTWVGTGEKVNTAFGNIDNVTAETTDGTCAYERLLIPTTEDFTITFIVELWNNYGTADTTDDVKLSTQAYTSTVSTDLVKGYAYNFKLDLTVGELIQFTVTSAPTWKNGNTTDSNEDDITDCVPLTAEPVVNS